MLKTKDDLTTICCDKCKRESTAHSSSSNQVFYKEKWTLNSGKKYEHLCYECLPAQDKKAFKAVSNILDRVSFPMHKNISKLNSADIELSRAVFAAQHKAIHEYSSFKTEEERDMYIIRRVQATIKELNEFLKHNS